MKITKNLQDKCRAASEKGYKNVYCVVGAYRATTYCVFHSIAKILAEQPGTDFRSAKPWCCAGMWTGHANTRMVGTDDIMYTELFKYF